MGGDTDRLSDFNEMLNLKTNEHGNLKLVLLLVNKCSV